MTFDKDIPSTIKLYCGDVDERIRACRSKKIAEQLKEHLCNELSATCRSEMIRAVLTNHVDELIKATFDQDGKNIFLEEQ